MTVYTKNFLVDGFEMYMMKTIVNREADNITLTDRLAAAYFIVSNFVQDTSNYSSLGREMRRERTAIWMDVWSGNLGHMRQYLADLAMGEKVVKAMIKNEVKNKVVWMRVAVYVVITVVICVLAFKVFGF